MKKEWVDPTRTAIVLRRVSTPQQVDNYSWKSQLDLADLAYKDGFTQVEVCDEPGISGESLDKRPELQRVLEKIQTGTVGALYLMNFSRGSRDEDMIDGRLIMQACRQYCTIIRLPEGPLDLNRESDEDLADINFLFAKRYKRDMIKNMSRGQYRKAQEGKFFGGRPRFGYRFKYTIVQTKRGPHMTTDWEIDPEEVEIARFIHQRFSRYSTRRWTAILNRLAKWGRVMWFPIKARKDQERTGKTTREWQQHDISNIIRNEMLIGRLCFAAYRDSAYKNGKRERSRHLKDMPPIYIYREDLRALEDETFERNNQLLDERANTPSRLVNSRNPFSGVLLCPHCLQRMYRHGGDTHQYLCSRYRQSGKIACRGFIVHEIAVMDVLFPIIVDLLQANIGPSIAVARQKPESESATARLRTDLERIERELENLMGYARAGAITAEQLKEQNSNLLKEKQMKQLQLAKTAKSNKDAQRVSCFTNEFLTNLPDFIQFLYDHKKPIFNQLVRLIFQGVVLNSDRHGSGKWKAGLKLKYGKKTPRPCFIESYTFDPRFEDWMKSINVVLPDALLNAGQNFVPSLPFRNLLHSSGRTSIS